MLHLGFWLISMCIIGYEPMVCNLWLGILGYSCYLTLNVCKIYFYLFCLLSSLIGGMEWGFNHTYFGSGGSKKGLQDY